MAKRHTDSQAKVTETRDHSVGIALKNVLNSHGYPFQESVASAISQISTHSSWFPLVLEFPVQVQERDTRIDIVLTNSIHTVYLVCECKRANPALANWCFARSSNTPGSALSEYARLDALGRDPLGKIEATTKELSRGGPPPFEIAVEVRTSSKRDDAGKKRGQIEEAATQVCRGLKGLIDSFADRGLPRLGSEDLLFLPVLITTANLWITESEINLASLETGELQDESLPVNAVPWLWYDYPQSPGLKHSVPQHIASHGLAILLYDRFVRTIAIVTPKGMKDFLCAPMWSRVAPCPLV